MPEPTPLRAQAREKHSAHKIELVDLPPNAGHADIFILTEETKAEGSVAPIRMLRYTFSRECEGIMNLAARVLVLVATGLMGVAALNWPTAPSVLAILPGDPDLILIGASALLLSITARLAILAPTWRIACARTSVFNGLGCLGFATLRLSHELATAGQVAAPTYAELGVGAVVAAAGLTLLSGARTGDGALKNAFDQSAAEPSDFAPEETLLYRQEGGADYRAFVRRVWANAEVVIAPLAVSVDGTPCRIVSIASRPKGGCYVNVILDGVGYTLMAHAHQWSTEDGPVDVATWSLQLLAAEESSGNRHTAHK